VQFTSIFGLRMSPSTARAITQRPPKHARDKTALEEPDHQDLVSALEEMPVDEMGHDCPALCSNMRLQKQAYSITCSARASSGGRGMVSPTILLVFRLMLSSTLVAYCTGMSSGFSPLRILPVFHSGSMILCGVLAEHEFRDAMVECYVSDDKFCSTCIRPTQRRT
jgi:hypothetical protein